MAEQKTEKAQKPEWHPDGPGWAARTLSSDHPLSLLLYRHGLISAEFTPGWTECACGWRADTENPGWHRLHVAYEVEQRVLSAVKEGDRG